MVITLIKKAYNKPIIIMIEGNITISCQYIKNTFKYGELDETLTCFFLKRQFQIILGESISY